MSSVPSHPKEAVRLLVNLALLALIILTINQIVLALLPYPWAEDQFYERFTAYLDGEQMYDTLFVGSSRMMRHVDPAAFDQEFSGQKRLRSYNLGVPANFFPKTYRNLEEVLAHDPDNLKTVFFELTTSSTWPREANWHTVGQAYWYDLNSTVYFLRSLWRSAAENEDKVLYTAVHLGALLEKNLNFGYGVPIMDFLRSNTEQDALSEEWQARDGYLSLDEAAATETEERQAYLRRRQADLLAKPEALTENGETTRALYDKTELWESTVLEGSYNEVALEQLTAMLALAEERDIEFVFVLPPRLGGAYRELLPLFYALPADKRIEMIDPDKYPEFYNLENSFDLAHLNESGAREFSRALAREFLALKE